MLALIEIADITKYRLKIARESSCLVCRSIRIMELVSKTEIKSASFRRTMTTQPSLSEQRWSRHLQTFMRSGVVNTDD